MEALAQLLEEFAHDPVRVSKALRISAQASPQLLLQCSLPLLRTVPNHRGFDYLSR